MSQLVKNFVRRCQDGLYLSRALFQNRGSNFRPLLLDQARQSNSVATSLLYVDKEIGSIRYYGLSDYVRKRMQSTLPQVTSSTDNAASPSTPTGGTPGESSSTPTKAKIAFMVTSSMRQELASEELGYDADQIKKLTPLQASLILQHKIPFSEMEEKLPVAEAEYEAQRAEEEEATRLLAEEDAQRLIQEQQTQQQQQQQYVQQSGELQQLESSTLKFPQSTTQVFTGSYMSINELDNPQASSTLPMVDLSAFEGKEWFEVQETNAAGEVSRVGLYNDKDEAILGQEARQQIAEAKKTGCTFQVRHLQPEEIIQ